MNMKILKYVTIVCSAASIAFTSCVKDKLFNTPHPDRGAVRVTSDWSESAEASVPDNYTLRIGEKEQDVSGESNPFNDLFDPGRYFLLVYNKPDGITIDGTTATVNTLDNGILQDMPGYLFSSRNMLDITADDTLRVTAMMKQHIRMVTLELQLGDGDDTRISSIRATLHGIAHTVDLETGELAEGQAGKSLQPEFELWGGNAGTRASLSNPLLLASFRFMGIIHTEMQLLLMDITLADGSTHVIGTDLSEALMLTGSGMDPLVLDAGLELPVEAGASGSITDWAVVDNGSVEIN